MLIDMGKNAHAVLLSGKKAGKQMCMILVYRKCAHVWVHACASEWALLTHSKMLTVVILVD